MVIGNTMFFPIRPPAGEKCSFEGCPNQKKLHSSNEGTNISSDRLYKLICEELLVIRFCSTRLISFIFGRHRYIIIMIICYKIDVAYSYQMHSR